MTIFDLGGNCSSLSIGLLRGICVQETATVIVCYSVVDRDSFRDVRALWVPLVRQANPSAGIILVGLQVRGTHPSHFEPR